MREKAVYTVGHGHRSPAELLRILQRLDIRFLVDVRSVPYSRFNPGCNREALRRVTKDEGLNYVYMGEGLGGRPSDPALWCADGRADYGKIKATHLFQRDIQRLKTAYEKDIPVVVMCSESNPCGCHRSRLIGAVLADMDIRVLHIDEKERLRSQADVINEYNKGMSDNLLF
ncbi:DUF488 domain-containing protein [Chitinophagaceae bacterium MMS25-I14]